MNAEERESLIRAHLPLVRKIARRIHRLVPTVDFGDLVGDGSIGLLRAVDQFDPNRGIPLAQYARRLISGSMLNGIRRMDPVPERARRLVRDAEATRYRMASERGFVPTNSALEAIHPGYLRAQCAAHESVPLSLDAPFPEGARVVSDWSNDPAKIVLARTHVESVRRALDELSPRQRNVVCEHYYGDRSLREVGKRLNISSQRASQLHQTAILRLRRVLDARAG